MFASVAIFGVATIVFGLSTWFPLSLLALFVLGASDMVSVNIRGSLIQLSTPDVMRGRVSAVSMLFIGASNELGAFESGLVAQMFSPIVAVVSGGIGTILVVIMSALLWPELRRYGRLGGEPAGASGAFPVVEAGLSGDPEDEPAPDTA